MVGSCEVSISLSGCTAKHNGSWRSDITGQTSGMCYHLAVGQCTGSGSLSRGRAEACKQVHVSWTLATALFQSQASKPGSTLQSLPGRQAGLPWTVFSWTCPGALSLDLTSSCLILTTRFLNTLLVFYSTYSGPWSQNLSFWLRSSFMWYGLMSGELWHVPPPYPTPVDTDSIQSRPSVPVCII